MKDKLVFLRKFCYTQLNEYRMNFHCYIGGVDNEV